MKYFYAVVAFMCLLMVSNVAAQEGDDSAGKASAGKEIVVTNPESRADDAEFGVNNEREMPQSETYDPNTGLPNVVGSDKAGELE